MMILPLARYYPALDVFSFVTTIFVYIFRQLCSAYCSVVTIVSVGAGRGIAEAAGAGERGSTQLPANPRH